MGGHKSESGNVCFQKESGAVPQLYFNGLQQPTKSQVAYLNLLTTNFEDKEVEMGKRLNKA